MKLILVRHGETDANLNRVLQGRDGNHINQTGREQALATGKKLKKNYPKIDMVFCSPLNRCVETLECILMEYPIEGQISMSKLIEERDLGEYEGVEEYMIDWDVVNKDSKENREMGVESLEDMAKRINLFLEDLKLEGDDLTVLVVTHAGPIRMMKSKLMDKEIDFEEKIDNGSIHEFDYETELEN